ncbi:MAG TPA: hypothetical protein VKB46_21940 [Pyrinomonadaceae bacterium]|nr:hypothetical protein [Pyrinomonadaceae bacterium]
MINRPVALIVVTIYLLPAVSVTAQQKPSPNSALCTQVNALDTIKQQIADTRTFDNMVQRIAVLLRAADLLWPHQKEKALATFKEAFDLATQDFKATGDDPKQASQFLLASVPDQRYKVISALAKRDPAAAHKLSEQMLQDDAREAADKGANTDAANERTNGKLLTAAIDLLPSDISGALSFARSSLRYTATLYLTGFMYALAKVNKAAADEFYAEALNAYGSAPMNRFLYLSAYPFGNNRDAGEMPGYTTYAVPEGFNPNPNLQRLFVGQLLSRVQMALGSPVEASNAGPNSRFSDPAQMWLALSRLDKQIEGLSPELSASANQARDSLYALLNPKTQSAATNLISEGNRPEQSFDEQVEAAEKLTDVARRDQQLSFAVTRAAKTETVERVINVIDKISDSNVRNALTNWFYFFRTQALIKEKKLEEARKIAALVSELDQRAYLYSRIAEESLKQSEDQTAARELLNEISQAAGKAPQTIVTARTFLALAYLFSKFDMIRAIEELGHAVSCINRLEAPDFSRQYVTMKVEGKSFGSYSSFSTPGFNPENAFGELGKLDFDGALSQATAFSDKSLRSLTTLAVIEPCLQKIPPKTKGPAKTSL